MAVSWRVIAMLCVSAVVVAGMPGASAGAFDGTGSTAGDHCPAYVDSDLYRTRANQITLTPEDTDWELTLINAESDTEFLFEDGDYFFTRAGVYMTADNLTIRSASGNRDGVNFIGQGLFVRGEGLMVNGENYTIADISIRETRNHGIWMSAANGATRTHIYNVDLLDIGTQFIKGNSGAEHPDGIVACSSMGYSSIETVVGDYFAAIDLHTSVDWIIRDNYIYNMVGDGSGCEVDIDCGSYFSHPAILIWNNSRGTIIERNTMIDNTRSITLGLGNGHAGGVVRNNYIYQSVPGDAGIELWDAEGVVVEHNTVLTNNYRGAIEYGGSPNIILRNNLLNYPPLDRSGSRGPNTGALLEGNISDATNADFIAPGDPHIPADSRVIGAGVPLDTTSEIGDIDGDARNGRLDVGADHYKGAEGSTGFDDVPADVYFEAAVGWARLNGVTTGTSDTTFSPYDPVTRGQMATFLWRYAGEPAAGAHAFTDVPDGVFFSNPVRWLAESGITTGTTATTFSPDNTVTRGQMATFLWRFVGEPTAVAHSFVDVPDETFYNDAIAWMAETGVTTGTSDTTFSPEEPLTRAQAVTFLWRLDQLLAP